MGGRRMLTREETVKAFEHCYIAHSCKGCPLEEQGECHTVEPGVNRAVMHYLKENEPVPTTDVQEVKHGYWKFHKKTKLVPNNKVGIKEEYTNGHNCAIVDDKNVNQKIMIMMKRITLKIPICSVCGWYGYDEYDATPYCPSCGARMDGDSL